MTIYSLDFFLPQFGTSHFSMSGSNCCFLTCIQFSQGECKVISIFISLRIFQFVVFHTVKGYSVVNEAEVGVFLELSCFFYDPTDVGNLISYYNGCYILTGKDSCDKTF